MSDIVAKNLLLNYSCWYCKYSTDPELNNDDIICNLHRKIMQDDDVCEDFIEHEVWAKLRERGDKNG